jgi:TetR/AcrR family transcriptional repressor of nem operon
LDSAAQTKGERTRERILDVAYQSIVEKGFAATSIEELVEAAGITKSGYFYHFRDKNDMARQLFERFLAEDEGILGILEKRARELSDDPLQSFLIFLNLYAQMMDDMETLHPGCMVASITYQERMFDAEVRQMNVDYLLRMRRRFAGWLDDIMARHLPAAEVDIDGLADNLTAIVEGAIILSKALSDQGLMGRQTRLFRNHVKLIFGA